MIDKLIPWSPLCLCIWTCDDLQCRVYMTIVSEWYMLLHFTYQLFFSTCRNTWPTRAVVCLQWDGELYVCGHTLWIAASGVLTTMQVHDVEDVRRRRRRRERCQMCLYISWPCLESRPTRAFGFEGDANRIVCSIKKKRPASCVAVCT